MSTVKFFADMVSQRPFPKHWLQNVAKMAILHIFQTGHLIVMDLQDIPLNICFRVMNLNKVLRK